jgi:hypothetical protein
MGEVVSLTSIARAKAVEGAHCIAAPQSRPQTGLRAVDAAPEWRLLSPYRQRLWLEHLLRFGHLTASEHRLCRNVHDDLCTKLIFRRTEGQRRVLDHLLREAWEMAR